MLPVAKPSVKKLPKLRSRFVAPLQKKRTSSEKPVPLKEEPDGHPLPDDVKSASVDSSASEGKDAREKVEVVPGGSELCDKVVSEVSKVIDEIANFYGTGGTEYPRPAGYPCVAGYPGPAEHLGHNSSGKNTAQTCPTITSPPEASSEEIAVTALPSYVPENCTAADTTYQSRDQALTEAGKECDRSGDGGDVMNASSVAGEESVGVAMLENILVTEQDIFGDDDGMSDDDDDIDNDAAIYGNSGNDVVPEVKLLSAEELASIEEEFKKVTALPLGDPSTDTSQKKKTQVGCLISW